MKIAVLIKQVPDTASVFEIGGDGKSVLTDGLKYVMSPYDEHALEEAIKLKEANGAEVIVVSLGPLNTQDVLRTGLALGADSGLLVTGDGLDNLTNKGTAIVLAEALKTIEADLIFAGKQAVDDDASQTPERVAELLSLPHASAITRFELNDSQCTVDREIDGGYFSLELPLPALLTTQKGINTPRYPKLPNIMKAKRKEIKELCLSDLGLSADAVDSGLEVDGMTLPRQERLNNLIDGDISEQCNELIKALREVEKVL